MNSQANKKICFILFSASGAGKTTLAYELAKDDSYVIVSADHYFEENLNGFNKTYVFNPKLLGQAHQECRENFYDAIKQGKHVIVDNTNTRRSEWAYYVDMAKENGYEVVFIEPDTAWKYNVDELVKRNRHNVPRSMIEKQVERIKNSRKDREFALNSIS